MERLKNVLKKIKELIDSFTKPVKPEKSFDELAVEAGITREDDLNALKGSMEGVKWDFDEKIEEPKKGGKSKAVAPKETQVQPTQKIIETQQDLGMDR